MYATKVWGKGHTHERIIPSTLPSQHGRVIVFERWELYMGESYDDGVWDRDYWEPRTDPNRTPDRKAGDVRWSVGFGHTEGGDNPPYLIGPGYKISRVDAEKLLESDIGPKMRWVNARLGSVLLTPYMFTAITSLAYQFGQGRLDAANKGLTHDGKPLIVNGAPASFPFLDQFNHGDYVDAFITILGLNFKKNGKSSKGLILRRASEVGYAMTRKD
jgi:GH24 family phage-related lysozyme (muramidase)